MIAKIISRLWYKNVHNLHSISVSYYFWIVLFLFLFFLFLLSFLRKIYNICTIEDHVPFGENGNSLEKLQKFIVQRFIYSHSRIEAQDYPAASSRSQDKAEEEAWNRT